MPRSPLNNYIRRERKRLGLSQEELAFLLGLGNGATVSRYEGRRMPSLRVALAAARVFGVSVEALFAGEAEAVDVLVARRARVLREKLGEKEPRHGRERKIDLLSVLCERPRQPFA